MKRNLLVASAILSVGIFSTGSVYAQDQQRIDQLEKRVDGMETKLDAILEMLSKQAGKADGAAVNQSGGDDQADVGETPDTSGAATDLGELQPGMTLDLYAVDWPQDSKDIAAGPVGYPAVSEIVAVPNVFEQAAFIDVPSMKRFAGPSDKQVALSWTGLIRIPLSGKHIFQIEILVDNSSKTNACISTLKIDDRDVLRVDSVGKSNGYDSTSTRSNVGQGEINLAAGLHRFALWDHCLGRSRQDLSKVHFNLVAKGPNDRAPKPIDPSRFLTQAN
ncbi:exported hypothetical protein [Mesorhizobium plurifarium]|uniref:PA14 domain-containing protein n=1 Tax=Mesorhizobium plurifarium TaxID=69974 RepID=A0A0K2VND5_MESPL|nr:exported hypothetical protein [Mesorhizobium plurifarium]